MALMDIPNATSSRPSDTPSHPSHNDQEVSAKRPHESGDPGDGVEHPPSPKRPRSLDPPSSTPSPPKRKSKKVESLPEPSDTYIQLRFQLCRFKGVYRIARLPLSFTFAHLYRYLLFLFGRSGMHLHQFEVHSHVELYSDTYRPGEIKAHRTFRFPPEPDRNEDPRAWQAWSMLERKGMEDPVLRVGTGQRYDFDNEMMKGKGLPPLDMDSPFDRLWAQVQVPYRRDEEVTLGGIWNADREQNISGGVCCNSNLAIKFEYDLGDSWGVDITVDRDKEGHYRWRTDAPRNWPELIIAKGAPPLEDARNYSKDIDGKRKLVSNLLFMQDSF
ncbi:hypothetical protein C8Q77DRAFT_905523 [Trametes polyzona]|nr:hypothetical protein C8Q77DRAFT_905523 [Trametes polyzona]